MSLECTALCSRSRSFRQRGKIKQNIKGYEYGNNEHKILQCADDTNIFVTDFQSINDRKGLPRTINTYSLSMLFYITET